MIENKEKLPLKDMKPEEIKEIANTLYENMEFLWRGIGWRDGKVLTFLDPEGIYRTKPKKLTVNELYKSISTAGNNDSVMLIGTILSLISQTEGFNIEGEE